jgi:hypothetical protein
LKAKIKNHVKAKPVAGHFPTSAVALWKIPSGFPFPNYGDGAEVSFQPLVHELYVHSGLLAGTVAITSEFGCSLGSITSGRRRFVSGHSGA